MSKLKIVVPEGMKKAVRTAIFTDFTAVASEPQVMTVLEAALGWLSDNPPVPTVAQCREMLEGWNASEDETTYPEMSQFECAEWVRRMFLAPEPAPKPMIGNNAKIVIHRLRGWTPTPAEADAIVEELSHTAHGWDRGKR